MNRVNTNDPMTHAPANSGEPDPACRMIRHTLATLAYRASKAVRGAPAEFGSFAAGSTTRTPGQILAHMGDLMAWALTIAQQRIEWRVSPVRSWSEDVQRFFAGTAALDAYLASGVSFDAGTLGQLFQGPIADALTHTGQLTLMRRLAGAPIRAENYQRALIDVGHTGLEQPPPQREFD